MRRKIFSIWSILLVLVVSLGVLGLGCPGGTTGTIEVEATVDGSPVSGALDYTLTPDAGSPINGTSVSANHTADAGNWTCAYVSGGPAAAYLVDVTPSPTQTLAAGGTITFTLNFVTYAAQPLDAAVAFETWTINGTPVAPGIYQIGPDTIVDARYTNHVSGAGGARVKITQNDELQYHYQGPKPWTTLHVVNAWAAVQKQPGGADKLSQTATVNGLPVAPCDQIEVIQCVPITLDVHTEWEQVVCINYTKSINWIGFPSPPDILFDCSQFDTLGETIVLTTRACVTLDDHPDADPSNDCSGWSSPLTVIYDPTPAP